MRKFIVLLLALVACIGLAACGRGSGSRGDGREMAEKYGLPLSGMEDDDFITVTRFVDASAVQVSPDNEFIKAVESITNIRIEVEYLVGSPMEKIGVMIASGDLPDMVNVGVGEQSMFIDAGLYMPLQKLVEEHAPRYRQQFDQFWPFMLDTEGNKYVMSIWGVPSGTRNNVTYNGCAFYIQKAVLDYFGRAPRDIYEYFQFLREYRDAHPTIDGVPTIPFEAQMNDWRVWSLLHPSKFLNGYGNWGDVGVADLTTHVAYDPYAQPWYRDYFEILNAEFHRNTILAETFTRDHDGYLATIASGAVLGMFCQHWNFQSAEDLLRQEGRIERTYIPLGLVKDSSITPRYIENGNFEANNGFGISKDSPHAERIMKLVNWVMHEDVQRWLSWGIEGEHYYIEGGRYMRPDDQRVQQVGNAQWVRDNMGRWYRDLWPKIDGTFRNGNSTGPDGQPEEIFASMPEYDRQLFSKLGIQTRIGFMGDPWEVPVYFPFWAKNTFRHSGNEPDLIWERQVEALANNLPLIVTAPPGEFENRWARLEADLARIDVQPLIDALNADIRRWMDLAR